jgi:tetratricopeptide (TPR) repeat protein
MNHGRFAQAEVVLTRITAQSGSGGEDFLALGIAQGRLQKLDQSEAALTRAQKLMPRNPYPSLYLARVSQLRGDMQAERGLVERAIAIDADCLDAWGYLFERRHEIEGEAKALAAVEELAKDPANQKNVASCVAVQMFYARDAKTADKAMQWAKKAYARNADDPLALAALSSAYGQSGNLAAIIELLGPQEAKVVSDTRLANILFEALMQSRRTEEATALLAALARSPNREVSDFAAARSQAMVQLLQQQQQRLYAATARPPT